MITTTATITRTVHPTRPVEEALRALEAAGYEVTVREMYRGAVEVTFDNHDGGVYGTVRVGQRSGRFVGGNVGYASRGAGLPREYRLRTLAQVRALAA